MEADLEKQIEARLAELPSDVQQAIGSADLEKSLHDIGTKHQLHIDQMGNLQDETLLVMLGFSDPAEFSKQLEGNLHISKEAAGEISGEVNTQIFLPIRESMKAFAAKRSASHEATQNTAPAVPFEASAKKGPKDDFHPADKMLMSPTVTKAPPSPPPAPTAPPLYKTDPYREPPQ